MAGAAIATEIPGQCTYSGRSITPLLPLVSGHAIGFNRLARTAPDPVRSLHGAESSPGLLPAAGGKPGELVGQGSAFGVGLSEFKCALVCLTRVVASADATKQLRAG